jgi:hypothetical protein
LSLLTVFYLQVFCHFLSAKDLAGRLHFRELIDDSEPLLTYQYSNSQTKKLITRRKKWKMGSGKVYKI